MLTLYLSDFFSELYFMDIHFFFLKFSISDFVKIPPVGAELSRADRRTGRHDETNSRFSKFRDRT